MRYLLIALLLCSSLSYSQVTIGTSETPVEGALLQIKSIANITGGNPNALGGLNMPRVRLTADDITAGDIAGVDASNADDHIGLAVYNTNDFGYTPTKCPGLYTWTGNEWEALSLGSKAMNDESSLPTVADTDGNTYRYRKFGSLYWMTSNLRTTKTTAGGSFADKLYMNPGYASGAWGASSSPPIEVNNKSDLASSNSISFVENSQIRNLNYDEYASRFGLLYRQSHGLTACPTGWRLPTMQEWKDLANVLTGNLSTAGKAMKANNWSYTATDRTQEKPWGGFSVCSPENSGFNAFPVGYVIVSPTVDARLFGTHTFFHSSEIISGNIQYTGLIDNSSNLQLLNSNVNHYLSVRCVTTTP